MMFKNFSPKTPETIKEEKEDDDIPKLVDGINFENAAKNW